jgi:hypothetical protein
LDFQFVTRQPLLLKIEPGRFAVADPKGSKDLARLMIAGRLLAQGLTFEQAFGPHRTVDAIGGYTEPEGGRKHFGASV